MSTGKSEDDNEIANNILLNLFYDENHLDLIISNVRNYNRQSFGYGASREMYSEVGSWTSAHPSQALFSGFLNSFHKIVDCMSSQNDNA